MSLSTGERISRQQWTELPMPDSVISAVEAMAEKQKQPLIRKGGPAFEWCPGISIEDEHPGPDVVDTDQQAYDAEDDEEEDYEEDEEGDALHEEDNENEDENADDHEDVAEQEEETDDESVTEDEDDENIAEEDKEVPETLLENNESGDHDFAAQPINVEKEEDEPARPQTRYNLRANRERTYDNRFSHCMDNPHSSQSYDASFLHAGASVVPSLREAVQEMFASGSKGEVLNCITGFIFNQMTAKAGIKKHGKVAIDALYQEFLQLHDLDVFEGLHPDKLTKEQKRAALRAISVIKEKRCGKIKGRTVADGRAQKDLYTKDETASPTVSTDALMMSIMIDACEGRDTATADVAGAYLHADMDDFTILKIEGESVDIMCDVCEGYKKFVTYENKKRSYTCVC